MGVKKTLFSTFVPDCYATAAATHEDVSFGGLFLDEEPEGEEVAAAEAVGKSGFDALPSGGYLCRGCIYQAKSRTDMTRHVQAKHLPPLLDLPCKYCDKSFRSAKIRQAHFRRIHGVIMSVSEIAAIE